MSVFFRASKIT